VEDYDVGVSRLFFRDLRGRQCAAIRALGGAIAPYDPEDPAASTDANTITGPMYWGDPLDIRASKVMAPERMAAIRAAAEAIFPLLDQVRDPAIRHELGLSAFELVVLADRCETQAALVEALAAASVEELDAVIARLEAQRRHIPALAEEFLQRWEGHARHSEVGVTMGRFARQADQYRHAIVWVREQRDAAARGDAVAGLDAYDRAGFRGILDEVAAWVERLAEIVGLGNLPPDIREYIENARAQGRG
jgi:hypothetical protein